MPDVAQPLNGQQIKSFLLEVADELPLGGSQHTVIIVGGALLAWNGLRDSTRDVDSLLRMDHDLRTAVAAVASRHDLVPRWLNDSAAAFRPATFREADCVDLLDHPRLRILGAPMDQLFLMKLYRVDAQDFEDMVRIWPMCSFTSGHEVAHRFREAYPHAPEDEFLPSLIEDISIRAAHRA